MNFFGPVNIIRAAVPEMRRRNKGHVIVLSSISKSVLFSIFLSIYLFTDIRFDADMGKRSWSFGYARSWYVLRLWLGVGRVL